MASFSEQATLKVVDKSSAQIRKINAELKKLFATASSLKSANLNIRVNATGVAAANKQLLALSRTMSTLRRQSVTLNVNMRGINTATAALAHLHQQAARPVRVNVQHTGAGGGGAGGAPPAARRFGGRTPAGAAIAGAAAGLGVSNFSRLNAEFGVLAAAAYGASRALKLIGEAGYDRSRTELLTKATSSAAQQAVAAAMPPSWKGAPLPWGKNEFDKLVAGFRGDVGGATPEETERRAQVLARYAQNEIYPGIYARTGKTPAQSQEGIRELFKATNISTTELFDEKTGELSKDFDRVIKGVQIALAANAEIKPGLVKTIMAGSKTAGFTLEPAAIAGMLIQGGDFGRQVGNETFRLIRALTGGIDNKVLNNALADQGLLTGVKRNKRGNVIANSGTPPDVDLLLRNPGKYLLDKVIGKDKAKFEALDQVGKVNYLAKKFPSLPQTALNQLNQLILGADLARRAQEQAGIALQQDLPKLLAESPSAQLDNLKTALSDTAGTIGKLGLDAVGASGALTSFTKLIRGEQLTPDEKGVVATSGAGALGLGMLLLRLLGRGGVAGVALGGAASAATSAAGLSADAALNISAGLLDGAAGALTTAAWALGGRGLLPAAAGAAAAGTAGAAATGVTSAAIARAVLFSAARWAGPLGILLASTQPAGGESKDPEIEAINANREKLAKAYQEVAVVEQKRAALMKAQETANPQKFAALAQEIAALDASLATLRAAMDAASRAVDADTLRNRPSAPPTPGFIQHSAKELRQTTYPTKPWPTDAVPAPSWIPQLKTIGDTIQAGGVPLLGAASTLSSAPAVFTEVFGTGATAIGNAGSTAAEALWGRAPGIGQLIGDTAGQAIASAVSNLSVNVNANVKGAGPDTGAQKE